MYLDELFKNAPHLLIEQLSCDSRMPMKNCIFFCVEGIMFNGHNFVKEAIINGANVIVYDEEIDTSLNAIFIKVSNVLDVLNRIAAKFYDYPCKKMNTIVVSGCYGKSLITDVLTSINNKYEKTGYIGSLGIQYSNHQMMSVARTLPIIDTQRISKLMLDEGVKTSIYESSVLQLSYKKLNGVDPDYFIYTITGYDSFEYKELGKDYSNNLIDYINKLDKKTFMIINRDDPLCEDIINNSHNRYLSYGFSDYADYHISEVRYFPDHSEFILSYNNNEYEVYTKLLGKRSIYYLTAIIACLANKYPIEDIIAYLSECNPINGIMEPIELGQNYHVVVDNGKTYESLLSIFDWTKSIKTKKMKTLAIISIDYTDNIAKLNSIISLCEKYLDSVIFTEGDSYGKDIKSMMNYCISNTKRINVLSIEDREVAIDSAIQLLDEDDLLLVLGKGNENFIYRALGKDQYDGDSSICKNYIKKRMDDENETFEVY